jgi:hypothetical protein
MAQFFTKMTYVVLLNTRLERYKLYKHNLQTAVSKIHFTQRVTTENRKKSIIVRKMSSGAPRAN